MLALEGPPHTTGSISTGESGRGLQKGRINSVSGFSGLVRWRHQTVNKIWLIKRSRLPLLVSVKSLHLAEESREKSMVFTYRLMTVSKEHLCDRNPFPLPMHGSAPASHLCLWASPSWPPCTSLMLLRVWAMLFSDAATLQIFPTEDGYEPSSASPQSSAVAICH